MQISHETGKKKKEFDKLLHILNVELKSCTPELKIAHKLSRPRELILWFLCPLNILITTKFSMSPHFKRTQKTKKIIAWPSLQPLLGSLLCCGP
jgi:hypothetical protein